LKPSVQRWLDAFTARVTAAHDKTSIALKAELDKPLDPSSPIYEVLRESRELAARLPPVDDADVRRRLREYPEQSLVREDKDAVTALRRWLRRDPVTDRIAFAFDGDDWGLAAASAWNALAPDLRAAVQPAVEWLADTATARPTARWTKTLRQHCDSLPAAHAASWRDWTLARLVDFEHSDGRTEWATIGARPGVGARLGDTSEAVLVGLMWWCWHDPGSDRPALADALRRVAEAGWRHLPNVGARATAPGGLALQMLSSVGDDGREWVRTFAATRSGKQLQRAAEHALANPL
jgi:hypothetical protein